MIPGKEKMFTKHPYRWTTIGSMDHLDAAKLREFKTSIEILHLNNALVLVVAGDFNAAQTKVDQKYFGAIKKRTLLKEKHS
jgi:predicted Zn-dependent peptidase